MLKVSGIRLRFHSWYVMPWCVMCLCSGLRIRVFLNVCFQTVRYIQFVKVSVNINVPLNLILHGSVSTCLLVLCPRSGIISRSRLFSAQIPLLHPFWRIIMSGEAVGRICWSGSVDCRGNPHTSRLRRGGRKLACSHPEVRSPSPGTLSSRTGCCFVETSSAVSVRPWFSNGGSAAFHR